MSDPLEAARHGVLFIKAGKKRGAAIFAALFILTASTEGCAAVPYTGEMAPFAPAFAAAVKQFPGARGAIASHHGLASQEIENFYAALAASAHEVKSVILIGPDHYGKVRGAAALCPEDWKCGGGAVSADAAAVGLLKDVARLDVSAEPFIMEHSVGLHIPFIKRHFPNTAVTALIVSPKASTQRLSEIAARLAVLLDGQALMILSMDFSHGKTQAQAAAEDDKSIRALSAFDFKALPRLDIDAPKAAWLFLKILARTGDTKSQVLRRTDSAEITGAPSAPCTSYAFMVFGKE